MTEFNPIDQLALEEELTHRRVFPDNKILWHMGKYAVALVTGRPSAYELENSKSDWVPRVQVEPV